MMNRCARYFLTPAAVVLCLFAGPRQSVAAEPAPSQTHGTAYLREMPTTERVLPQYLVIETKGQANQARATQAFRAASAARTFSASIVRRTSLPFLIVGGCVGLAVWLVVGRIIAWLEKRGLVNCEQCDKPISKAATSCPHCGTVPVRLLGQLLPCHKCGELLREKRYRIVSVEKGSKYYIPQNVSVDSGTVTVSGGGTGWTPATYQVKHVICPQCGEQKPLRRLIDIKFVGFLYSIPAALVLYGLPFVFLGVLLSNNFSLDSWVVGIGGLFLSYACLYFISKRLIS